MSDFAKEGLLLGSKVAVGTGFSLDVGSVLARGGIELREVLVIRHAFVPIHEDTGESGVHADSTDEEILFYTGRQKADSQFFARVPPRFWMVFLKEGGNRARFWGLVENHGEAFKDERLRHFDLTLRPEFADLRGRLVIGWPAPRNWWVHGRTAATYPLLEIADNRPEPFPGFDALVLAYPMLQAVMREQKYAGWRTALSSVVGIYLITDTRDGRHYVGKADGAENISQRWAAYARDGHGGNIELKGLMPDSFRFSLLRVFDPSTPTHVIDRAERHFKEALDSRTHGLNRN